ncbi:MAG: site-2 protease family protein [Nanoarchaeota archaeon]
MVNFIALDLILLALFVLIAVVFLYKNRSNLKREGLMYLYRTKRGLSFIDYTGKKFEKILRPLQYLVVACGYVLMVSMIYLLVKTLFFYFQQSASSPLAKIPAVFPLIPYFPQIFNLQSFFPPFYFTYFILAIAVVAISHEFSHGIFAKLNKIKIHSTGFAFLGPFIGAFVEQDDKQMQKAKKFPQLAILAAGTFANILMAILFIIFMAVFFSLAYSPAGFSFDSYASSAINLSEVQSIQNITMNSIPFYVITVSNSTYFATHSLLYSATSQNASFALVFDDAPAIRYGLNGAITDINSIPIRTQKDLQNVLNSYKPGDTVEVNTIFNNSVISYNITLGDREGKAFLGIGTYPSRASGFSGIIYNLISLVKNPNTYYISNLGDYADFIYDLLWWIIIINILVALFNMFPAGILDGGRFLMLTVWGITGNKKAGDVALKIMTWFLLVVIALMMVKWIFVIF